MKLTRLRLSGMSLSRRLSLVFAVLLLTCCCLSVWLQMLSAGLQEEEVVQRLSRGLGAAIAKNSDLMGPQGVDPDAVEDLFESLMVVNPSVEVYLLAPDGRITTQVAPEGHVRRTRVDLAPVLSFLRGERMPIFGDNPRSDTGRKVFSAAPIDLHGRTVGYVYVMLQGENHDAMAARVTRSSLLRTTLWLTGLVTLLGLIAGLFAFRATTRPLRQLTGTVARFDPAGSGLPSADMPLLEHLRTGHDEIALLAQAFGAMATRIESQWKELTVQDRQRRELFANISHDLRTPLTSLHGYLETLLIKSDTLSPQDQRRYLEIALGQSQKVGRLAQEVFELARLEYGVVKPDIEVFVLGDLLQDVLQKFELAAEARQQCLTADMAPGLPRVAADLGMIERVLTNLLDNAIRHTPAGGQITVSVRRAGADSDAGVQVQICDTGTGLPAAIVANAFERPHFRTDAGAGSGGLGLVIVQRILELHGSRLCVGAPPALGSAGPAGTVLEFALPSAA